MHIPSDLIRKEMYSEPASIWYSFANNGKETAIIIKAPTISIKALIAGCPLKLVFGREEQFLCTGTQIYDIHDSPIIISGVQCNLEQHLALIRIFKEKKAPIFLFNEMDFCLAWTNCEFTENDSNKIINLIGEPRNLYVGPYSNETKTVHDNFDYIQEIISENPLINSMDMRIIECTPKKWEINNLNFFGHKGMQSVSIDFNNEGELFERLIAVSLESVFPVTLNKNPQTINNGIKREFTDILGFYSFGTFLIEAKDLSILNAGFGRNQNRRTSSVQRQVRKAIKQLVGASKTIKSGDIIVDEFSNELAFNRTIAPHCIVLVTELMHFGDWEDIAALLVESSQKTGSYFHLLDLREFISIIKGSQGKVEYIDNHLLKRFEMFMRIKSVFIRSISPIKQY